MSHLRRSGVPPQFLEVPLFQIHIESYMTSQFNTDQLRMPGGNVGKLDRRICKNHIVITAVQA